MKESFDHNRLLESPDLSDEAKAELRQRFKRYNPVLLQKQVHRAVNALMKVFPDLTIMTVRPFQEPGNRIY